MAVSGFHQFGRRKIEFHIPDLLHDIFMFFYKTADLVKLKTSHCRDHSLFFRDPDKHIRRDHSQSRMFQPAQCLQSNKILVFYRIYRLIIYFKQILFHSLLKKMLHFLFIAKALQDLAVRLNQDRILTVLYQRDHIFNIRKNTILFFQFFRIHDPADCSMERHLFVFDKKRLFQKFFYAISGFFIICQRVQHCQKAIACDTKDLH